MEQYNNLLRDILYSILFARYEHWQTRSFARHKGTEYYYSAMEDLIDTLAESMGSDHLPDRAQLSFGESEETFEDVINRLRQTINMFRMNTQLVTVEIEDILLDMLNTIRKTTYLLRLV